LVFHKVSSKPPKGEPRYPEINPAVFKPAARSRCLCIIGKRTKAWMPDKKMVPLLDVYLSSRLTVARLEPDAVPVLAEAEVAAEVTAEVAAEVVTEVPDGCGAGASAGPADSIAVSDDI
jgi:hypothetical protein